MSVVKDRCASCNDDGKKREVVEREDEGAEGRARPEVRGEK